jgi:hypothetical protein
VTEFEIVTGPIPNDLANEVSDAIHRAMERGLGLDEAACVVAGVAADYLRVEYGDRVLPELCEVITARVGQPLPSAA